MKKNDIFFERLEEPNRSSLLGLRQIILDVDPGISETTKYGMPCFTFNAKAVCYLWLDKKINQPYILFVEGQNLNHPLLEKGGRKRMKILRIDPDEDLPIDLINEILSIAIQLVK